uniref:FBD-associated F-box protein At4g10400-like n=1 Tax=Cicer arietinum TaxID=3827 RepID=A0A3Q7XS23_CICAR|nr:FBD-associated F-box protein At4g10400-like [Cicer arietinum]
MSLIGREDMLSALPDSIICHILSFLPTKHSATTSILSKRWKPLWLSVLDLDFFPQPFSEITVFRRVLYSITVSRDISLPIRSFRLQRFVARNANNQMDEFINAAIQRRVETLALDMEYESLHITLASNIFTCKTLTVLELKQIIVRDLPRINIPLLKSLHLDSVRFRHPKYIIDFLLGCPALEELQTNRILVRKDSSYEIEIIKCLPNLVRATSTTAIPFFLISRAHVLTLKLKSPSSFQVPTFHNLTQMELFFNFFIFINYKIYRDWPHKWRWMLEVLRQSPKLQRLIIHEEEKEIENEFDEENWEDPQVVPECLSSQLKTCLFTNCRGRECQLQFVEYVMLNSKVLRTMTIHTASCIDLKTKYQILKKLAVCPRSCNLMFD